jgi:glycosyltransferase involved in cell wall biosynthesis
MDVSVLTPSYEYGSFFADGMESVIQQRGLRLQHIIQDAGSGDETLEVAVRTRRWLRGWRTSTVRTACRGAM